MILYSVNYSGPNSQYEWSIVTIHKSEEGAEKAMNQYKQNCKNNDITNVDYCIIEIDTDSDNDCIYDYNDVTEEYD